MKEISQELLSRVLDEDISEFETQRILKEMKSNDGLRSTLYRYNVIGYAMRDELPKQINSNFVHNVMSKLTDEEMSVPEFNGDNEIEKGNHAKDSGRFKTAIGLAIAASVAVVSFVSFQNYVQTNNETTTTAIVADRVVEESDIQRVSSEDLQNFISNPEAAASFNSYIMNHAEYASPRVSVPHVRIVGYGKDDIDTND
ncbi:MAG: sigma-E factor negative regulatory protein [Gammaproteobacteria bacterium]|nr:sigma-E factor negative regulatory protein [Gammaproteobacteria bacterium]